VIWEGKPVKRLIIAKLGNYTKSPIDLELGSEPEIPSRPKRLSSPKRLQGAPWYGD